MTIEYKDSKRIVKLSTDEILKFSDDFPSSPDEWILNGNHSIENGYLYADGDNNFSYKSFEIGSPTNFTVDFNYAPLAGTGTAPNNTPRIC